MWRRRTGPQVPEVTEPIVVQAAMHENQIPRTAVNQCAKMQNPAKTPHAAHAAPARLPTSGTVVLDVEQGGIVVPSFRRQDGS